jgi:hypothetical protein
VFELCRSKLVGQGWDELLKKGHGLDIDQPTPADLAKELARPGLAVNRTLAGFSDFSAAGDKGIEPGSPSRSLLFHALASPNVLNRIDGHRLGYFPNLAELDAVENYVFGARPPSLEELLERTEGAELTVVVFASEYRPSGQTCHGLHADMAYSRTGIARVGTAAARYVPELRGFLPESEAGPLVICVSPARYAAYLAVRLKGDDREFRPMRFRTSQDLDKPDDQRDFRIPVHKLFAGDECLRGLDLTVTYSATHTNEKLYRIHKVILGEKQPKTTPPFRFRTGIAALSGAPEHGPGLLVPEPHDKLVEEAVLSGRPLTWPVPPYKPTPRRPDPAFSSFEFPGGSGAPEYVHIRTEIRPNQPPFDLNTLPEDQLMARVKAGGYQALHYVDFTGEGWVGVSCPELERVKGVARKPQAAYSLVTAPDFFPSCDQRQLTEWTASNRVPQSIRKAIWNIPPDTLADIRLPANLQLDKNPFDPTEDTVTAVVSLFGPSGTGQKPTSDDSRRHSHLPDDAAGVFAPGWDVSTDTWKENGQSVQHLAGYGLGSPFPEDAKLCAALSTFWPAVAPDSTREMEPTQGNQSSTVSPLTDQEIGQVGDLSWDGVPGPRLVQDGVKGFVEYASFQHVDYVRNALAGLFTLRLTGRVDAPEYQRRVLAAAFAYLALGFERTDPHAVIDPMKLKEERLRWKMVSFLNVIQGTPELERAKTEAKVDLAGEVYRLEFIPRGNVRPVEGNVRKKRVDFTERYLLFVDPLNREAAVREKAQDTWHKGQFVV